ncbi:MAG: hypothetical protein KBC96_03080 [Armatimonadetes bacterium]|nr:hypothetical protein [Armatimonadota bacterium]
MKLAGFNGRYGLMAVVVLVAAVAGWLASLWVSARLDAGADERRRMAEVDEYEGLGERSGIKNDLVLDVRPAAQSVASGAPIGLTVLLTNRGSRSIMLSSWVEPYPAILASNQLPLKVDIKRGGERTTYHGDAAVMPLHRKGDFLSVRPGETKSFAVEINKPGARGRWDMSAPGTYEIALWYETYLSGKYAGVRAWTGMTNPVVVTATVFGIRENAQ